MFMLVVTAPIPIRVEANSAVQKAVHVYIPRLAVSVADCPSFHSFLLQLRLALVDLHD